MKKLAVQTNIKHDECQTPKIAIFPLIPYLNKSWNILECAYGGGSLARHLTEEGFNVIGNKDTDFLRNIDLEVYFGCNIDFIITNPPYSLKEEFLERAFKIGKPFAFLLPLTALEGKKRGELFRRYGIQLIIPNKRINFILPEGKGNSGSWFQTAWFCWKLNLPKDLNFVEL